MSCSDKKCCVPGCMAGRGSLEVLHSFPNPDKDKERFYLWITNIKDSLMNMDSNHIYKYRRVCRAHFEGKFLCRYNRISNIAVPTLNIPGYSEPPATNMVEEASRFESIQIVCQKGKTTILSPRVKRHGKRLIATTAAERNMYKKLVTMRIKLSKYKNKAKKQSAAVKAARNLVANPALVKVMERLPTAAKMLTLMQCAINAHKNA